MIAEVIIGKPLVTAEEIGFDSPIFTEERYLPKLLVSLGIFKSNNEVRKNRPDLATTLNKMDFIELKIGKHRVWLLVGK